APQRPRPRPDACPRLRARFHPPRRGQLPGELRRDPRAGHRFGRGEGAAVPARQGPGLGHGRVRHAAPRHPHPRRARGGQGQAVGPHPGNPAADRALAAGRDGPRQARRAADRARLRRDPGRRGHAHGGDLRRMGGAAAGGGRAEAGRRPDPHAGGGGVVRLPRGHGGAGPGLCRGFNRGERRQLRADRRRRDRRGATDRRGRDVRRGRPATAAATGADRLRGNLRGTAAGGRPV
ncbi:MAG: Ribonuclease PH, partial [uncultured Sphingomonas sp.]